MRRNARGERKNRFLTVAALIGSAVPTLQNAAFAQSGGGYVITKSTVDGGGVTFHTDGQPDGYKLGGTVGQHDAGGPLTDTGGIYRLTGGFWRGTPQPPTVCCDPCVGGSNAGQPCAQQSDCPGGACGLKNRYITGAIPVTATTHGIKVRLANIGADSVATPSNYNGTDRWVGAPTLGVSDGAGFPTFNVGKIQCAFASMDRSAVGSLNMYGDVIVPGSTYDVSVCSTIAGPCSTALRIGTAKFGDVIAPVNTVNFSDAFSIVANFQGAPTRPSKTRADLVAAVLAPSNANAVNFSDVGACVSAFQSKKFREVVPAPPATCP